MLLGTFDLLGTLNSTHTIKLLPPSD